MNIKLWALSWVLLTSLSWASPVDAEVIPELKGNRIVGVDTSTQSEAWSIQHLSIPEGEEHDVVKPIQHRGVWYYVIRGDLMQLDLDRGAIAKRTQFPAKISEFVIKDDALFVRLDTDALGLGDANFVDVPAASPPPGAWNSFLRVGLRARRDVPSELADHELFKKHTGDWAEVRATLRDMELRDPTNAFLPAYRGIAAERDGDTQAAELAFEKALATPSPWNDLIGLCAVLDLGKRGAEADRACASAKSGMKAQGLNHKDLTSLILFVVVGQVFGEAMREAINDRDPARVDQIGRHMFDLFPNVEAGIVAWRTLAIWMAEKEQVKLAGEWTRRADLTRENAGKHSMPFDARLADLWMLLLICPFLALPLGGLAAGLRPRESYADGWRGWLPRLNILEVILCAAFLATVIPFSINAKAAVENIGMAAEMPLAALQGGLASPDVGVWLAELSPSPEQEALLKFHTEALQSAKAGTAPPQAPRMEVLLTAMRKTSVDRSEKNFWNVEGVFGNRSPMPSMVLGWGVPGVVLSLLPALVVFLLFSLLGIAFVRELPKLAALARIVVLGSLNPILAMVLNFMFIAGFLRIATPVGSILQSIATPAFERYFGMEALSEMAANALYPTDSLWPWAVMGGAVIVHVATLLGARLAASSDRHEGRASA